MKVQPLGFALSQQPVLTTCLFYAPPDLELSRVALSFGGSSGILVGSRKSRHILQGSLIGNKADPFSFVDLGLSPQ